MDWLKEHADLVLGGRSDVAKNINARKSLFENGILPFPQDYLDFVKEINGVKSDTVRVFGIDAEEKNSVNDAVAQNLLLNRTDKDKVVVLGYNMFDYLVYDASSKEYQLRDKEDDAIIYNYQDLETAMMVLIGV